MAKRIPVTPTPDPRIERIRAILQDALRFNICGVFVKTGMVGTAQAAANGRWSS